VLPPRYSRRISELLRSPTKSSKRNRGKHVRAYDG